MKKIQTAEELLLEIMSCLKIDGGIQELNKNDSTLVPYLIKQINNRTILHVEAALKEASEKAVIIADPNSYCGNTGSEYPPDEIVSKPSILTAYPITNIK